MGIVVFCVMFALVFIAYGSFLVLRLEREANALRQKMEAWKEYAIAVEAVYDCEAEMDRLPDSKEYRKLGRQADNAADAATCALLRLRTLGEYLDAYRSSPFLPPAGSYEESIERLRTGREIEQRWREIEAEEDSRRPAEGPVNP